MLLFSDGFEYFHPMSLGWKWDLILGYESASWMYTFGSGSDLDVSDLCKIVFGEDTSVNPSMPFARKNGRALKIDNSLRLYKQIRKSRTVFLGFAFRYQNASSGNIKIHYLANGQNTKIVHPNLPAYEPPHEKICTATHEIRDTYVDTTWNFDSLSSESNAYTNVYCPGSPLNGDFHYIEFGLTILGNDPGGASAWVETRMGANRASKAENIYTVNPDSAYDHLRHFIGGIVIETGNITLDDLYIGNDEGSFNNSFLGDVRIRARKPEADGTKQDGLPVNANPGGSFTAVQTDFVRTDGEGVPTPEPTAEEDPLYISWDDPLGNYIQMKREGDEQLFKFSHPNFAGSEPKIFGAIAYVMCRPEPDNPIRNAKLTPLLKPFGDANSQEGREWIRPAFVSIPNPANNDGGFGGGIYWEETRRYNELIEMVYENQEEVVYEWGQIPEVWNTTTLNNSEFGFKLERFAETKEKAGLRSYDFLRHKIDFDEKIFDSVLIEDLCHRFFDKTVDEYWNFQDSSEREYTWAFYEGLQINEEFAHGARGCVKWLNSVLDLNVNIPWFIFWVHEEMGLSDVTNIDWMQVLEDGLDAGDSAYGFWVEEFAESLSLESVSSAPMIFKALDGLEMNEKQVQTNHELIEDGLDIIEGYVWSGHEWLGETLYPEDLPRVGILSEALESLELEEDHFDGNWVQFDNHQVSLTEEVETQQWRHEFFMGVIVDSWQIEPIEQPNMQDGDRAGQITSQYWDMVGYPSDPFED